MTKKFDEKAFQGKLIWTPVPGHRGIRRRCHWNEAKLRYEDPPSGPLYEARRVEKTGSERLSKAFSSLREAREWKERRTVEQAAPTTIKTYTVEELVRDFKAKRYPFLSEGTIILYERRLGLLGPLLLKEVDSITPKDVSKWLDWLKHPERLAKARSSRISFEKELGTLSALLRWHLEENDESKLIFPIKRKHYERIQLRKRPARNVVLSDSELDRWMTELKKGDPLYHVVAMVQVHQALRVSEVCAMKWNSLDLENGRYEIREHVIWPRVGGRAAKLVPGTKTNAEAYWIPLWEEVQKVLRNLAGQAGSELIFTKDGGLLTYRQVQAAYDRAFERAGLPHRGTHVCRHTGSTLFLDKTQDLLALQQLGGWKNQHMPQHYAKIRSNRLENTMRASERRLKVASKSDGEPKIG
jgi:integrase